MPRLVTSLSNCGLHGPQPCNLFLRFLCALTIHFGAKTRSPACRSILGSCACFSRGPEQGTKRTPRKSRWRQALSYPLPEAATQEGKDEMRKIDGIVILRRWSDLHRHKVIFLYPIMHPVISAAKSGSTITNVSMRASDAV